MRKILRRFPVAVVRRVAFFVTLAASAITILNYTGSLPRGRTFGATNGGLF